MPEQLTDVKITKVYVGKSGEGKFGPYTAYNFYVQDSNKKFGWFGGPKKITPVEGMQLAYMEYTTTQDGEYTNNKVSKLVVKEGSPQPTDNPPAQAKTNNGSLSMYVSYMKDIAVAIMNSGGELSITDLDAIARKIAQAGMVMMQASVKPPEKPQNAPQSTQPAKSEPVQLKGDPKKDFNRCEWMNGEGNPKHKAPVTAIYCLTSCMETSRCSMAGQLREKYPEYGNL